MNGKHGWHGQGLHGHEAMPTEQIRTGAEIVTSELKFNLLGLPLQTSAFQGPSLAALLGHL